MTNNCQYILVTRNEILMTIGKEDVRIERFCSIFSSRCYKEDYMSILRELWKQRISSFVLMEDDVFICPNVYEKLDECQKKRHNCKLGNRATFNYFYHYQFSSFTNSSN